MSDTKVINSNSAPQQTKHKITVADKDIIYTNAKQTLLECLEESDVEVHYHCRDGYCGACRVTLKKGNIDYFKGEPLAYMRPNEILPCCCKPNSDIDIEID